MKASFLSRLIGRFVRDAVPVDGVVPFNPGEANQDPKNPAVESQPPPPRGNGAELDPRHFPIRWANFR